ncbi:hypothetical protein G6F56_014631 [Rhizopus delemar]|nr:hypothetical protein G6F56_014631 [Rhizopus delemar]
MSFTRALAICASSSRWVTCAMDRSAKAATIRSRKASRLAVRCEFDRKRGSSARSAWRSTWAQNTRHSRSFCRPSMMVAPSPTGNGP